MLKINTIEEFREIPDSYYITKDGKVFKLVNNEIRLLKHIKKNGYEFIPLRFNNHKRIDIAIHRLVGFAYIPNPLNKPLVHHKDENKLNNDVSNLQWVTYKENSMLSSKSKEMYKKQIKLDVNIVLDNSKKAKDNVIYIKKESELKPIELKEINQITISDLVKKGIRKVMSW